jgi:hypothetical protein
MLSILISVIWTILDTSFMAMQVEVFDFQTVIPWLLCSFYQMKSFSQLDNGLTFLLY